jgi:hypothetical protein
LTRGERELRRLRGLALREPLALGTASHASVVLLHVHESIDRSPIRATPVPHRFGVSAAIGRSGVLEQPMQALIPSTRVGKAREKVSTSARSRRPDERSER